ncbi:hypothetical protein BS17DRAFT_814006 [Gyrodon lividus]|nr:hypothetical protein BS17DRAFT_814006 [Gyrodon lividus]
MTVIGKGSKVVQNTPFQLKTQQTDRVLKHPPGNQVGPSKLKDTPAVRPLGDKTPFPNRTATNQAILPAAGAKISKPALLEGSLRPSSARKHVRLPGSASKSFETPVTGGHHWDVSDIDIEVDTAAVNKSIEAEDYGEIEYMPPKVDEIPYEPPFEMPNYREVGETLMTLIRSCAVEDDPPTIADVSFTTHESENNFFAPPTLPQRALGERRQSVCTSQTRVQSRALPFNGPTEDNQHSRWAFDASSSSTGDVGVTDSCPDDSYIVYCSAARRCAEHTPPIFSASHACSYGTVNSESACLASHDSSAFRRALYPSCSSRHSCTLSWNIYRTAYDERDDKDYKEHRPY